MSSSTGPLPVAGSEVPFIDALQVILGYCLGSEEGAKWQMPAGGVGEADFEPDRVGVFAYRLYDCVKPSPGSGIEQVDVLVANGLNAQMYERDIAAALSVARAVSVCLGRIDSDTKYWDLDREEVAKAPTDENEKAWPIWRAWTLLMGVPRISIARTHKILHHKRPAVFPMVDNRTKALLGSEPWSTIHDDLTSRADGWTRLEERVNTALLANGGVELTRRRLHDILVWCAAEPKDRQAALDHGAAYV